MPCDPSACRSEIYADVWDGLASVLIAGVGVVLTVLPQMIRL